MSTYQILVALCLAVILFAFVGMMIKKAGKAVVLCSLVLLLIIGPVSCAALTK